MNSASVAEKDLLSRKNAEAVEACILQIRKQFEGQIALLNNHLEHQKVVQLLSPKGCATIIQH
jgi:hypothetical protein